MTMVAHDQAMRYQNELKSDLWDSTVDERNTARMKRIVDEIGWPTISKVGYEPSHGAWLLVQHSDKDVSFQIRCLDLMKAALLQEEVESKDVAYLEDRVRVNQGLHQIYGTQFTQINGRHVPRPILHPARVDEYRAKMGLGTLADGILHISEKYPLKKENLIVRNLKQLFARY